VDKKGKEFGETSGRGRETEEGDEGNIFKVHYTHMQR
jgi:hypothetical protein